MPGERWPTALRSPWICIN